MSKYRRQSEVRGWLPSLGLAALIGAGADGDFDGVADELTIGDMSALAVYLAAQPRPTTRLELDSLGLLDPPLTPEEKARLSAQDQADVIAYLDNLVLFKLPED